MSGASAMFGNFWNQTKQGASDAKDLASLGAQRTKLNTELKFLEQKIKSRKEKFGIAIYGPLVNDNKTDIDAVVLECKKEIDGLEEQERAKLAEIESLKQKMDGIMKGDAAPAADPEA
ncbi:hypothetical protein CYMTET_21951 [Cymbomonas tetramitiformis]|uniref:Uncharacterized protein n=1 Tax=Cymbomonas tetramitiformis TaxID=36881 RepID=A0AAE0G1J4_9CHLO|nr:hypothetical protein CYMTET_21951 [Cymbomonas tetramitiformis]|eukprot:gene23407-28336_t